MEQFLEKVAWPEAQLPLERSHEVVPPRPVASRTVVPPGPVPARTIIPPGPVPARTEPTSAEPQPPLVDPPAFLELEILSPPAPPMIIIPDDLADEAAAPPDSHHLAT